MQLGYYKETYYLTVFSKLCKYSTHFKVKNGFNMLYNIYISGVDPQQTAFSKKKL